MMGAKNHAVVMPDANKEQSLNALVGAGFGAAGAAWPPRLPCSWARPTSGSPHRREGEDAQGQWRHRKGADLGPVISKQALARIEGLIEDGVKEGAKLELDGRR
jgi:malonate-semialdehyde dehydrogenase (acetylating)/methylmalonate-semialdehyde dehydrogenase